MVSVVELPVMTPKSFASLVPALVVTPITAAACPVDVETVTVTPAEGVSMLPLSSVARDLIVNEPVANGAQL